MFCSEFIVHQTVKCAAVILGTLSLASKSTTAHQPDRYTFYQLSTRH